MIEITLVTKKMERKGIERTEKEKIKIVKPSTYKELEQTVREKFNLKGREIAIKIITPDNEENNINDDESYNEKEYKNLTKYRVILDELEGEVQEKEEFVIEDFNIDEILNIEKEIKISENEFKTLLEKELIEELKNQDFLIKEENEKKDIIGYQNELLEQIKKEISSIYDNSKNNFLKSIKGEFSSIEENLNKALNILKFDEDNNEIDKLNDLNDLGNYIPFMNNEKGINKDEPIVKLSIDSEKDYDIFEEQASNIKIDNIIIKNLSNSKITNQNLYWVKDNDSDVDILMDKKEIKIKEFEKDEAKKTELNIRIRNPQINKNYFIKFDICNNSNEKVTEKPLLININLIKKKKEDPVIIQQEQPVEVHNEQPVEVQNEQPAVLQNEQPAVVQGVNEMSQEEVDLIYQEFEESHYVSGFIDKLEMESKIREYRGDRKKIENFVESKV